MTYPSPAELLPHGPEMVLLDEVVEWHDKRALCRLRLREGSPFVEGGRARSAVALEYMAQCVGVCTALGSLERGEPLRMGYLVGVRTMTLEADYLEVGDELLVAATEEYDGGELGSFACTVHRRGELVVAATLSVYRRLDDDGPGSCADR